MIKKFLKEKIITLTLTLIWVTGLILLSPIGIIEEPIPWWASFTLAILGFGLGVSWSMVLFTSGKK